MANLIIEVPDDLVRSLEDIATAQRKSIQQLALEGLSRSSKRSPNLDLDPRRRSYGPCSNRPTRAPRMLTASKLP